MIGALAEAPLPALSTTLESDAFSQGDSEQRVLESKTATLMFTLGLNCQLARDNGLWTRDLERRYRELQRLEEDDAGNEGHLEGVAGLIARVEQALAEARVEYTPAMSALKDEQHDVGLDA